MLGPHIAAPSSATHVASEGAYSAARADVPVLQAYPARGAAEPIRLVLACQDVEWFEPPLAPVAALCAAQLDGYPLRRLPRFLGAGGADACGGRAILQHLGRAYGMYGRDLAEAAAIDTVLSCWEELAAALQALWQGERLGEAALAGYVGSVLAPLEEAPRLRPGVQGPLMASLEAMARTGGGDAAAAQPAGGRDRDGAAAARWLATQAGMSIADVAAFDLVDAHLQQPRLGEALRARFPALMALHARVGADAGIATYLASDNRHAQLWPPPANEGLQAPAHQGGGS